MIDHNNAEDALDADLQTTDETARAAESRTELLEDEAELETDGPVPYYLNYAYGTDVGSDVLTAPDPIPEIEPESSA